jgi:aryl-phospho-beta-D-glucosidase BglC (GH1 family)
MLRIQGQWFIDAQGRQTLLHGVNLGGSSKIPSSHPLQIEDDFSDHRNVSFVGRPFPLKEAHEHYSRLQEWGFNTLRFITTWEAIEHSAPDVYDTEYLDYFAEVVRLAGEYGFNVIIDPHQDVWSRMTGGDGAPGWTLEAVGFNIPNLDASEAAITMQARYPNYSTMIWIDNFCRLACCTMFSLFYAGKWLVPDLEIDGVQVQEYLQDHFIRSIQQIAMRVKDMPHVIGYGPLNEPAKGYLGLGSLSEVVGFPQRNVVVSPANSILLGAGFPRRVPTTDTQNMKVNIIGETILNPNGISAWKSPEHDVWHQVGVWDYEDENGEPTIVCDDYFDGIDFLRDGLVPFTIRYAEAMRQLHPDAIIFAESTPGEAEHLNLSTEQLPNIVNAGHWYDERMLITKKFDGETAIDRRSFSLVHGQDAMQDLYNRNIAELVQLSQEKMGGIPTLIGEFGLAYDINDKEAFTSGDFVLHELALSMYYNALDANLASSTQWNYTADNNNQWGDNWNQEDLSIYCADNDGGRAVRGFSRPYVQHSGGDLKGVNFDPKTAHFTTTIHFSDNAPDTEIYLPKIWYPKGCRIETSSGQAKIDGQKVIWQKAATGLQTLAIYPQ